MRRLARATAVLALGLASTGASASSPVVVEAPGGSGFSQVGGSSSVDRGTSLLRGLRELDRGITPPGSVLVGDEAPIPPASGVSVTLSAMDVDADGNTELLQIRGTSVKPRISMTDGATGLPIWERAMSTIYFSTRVISLAQGDDVLLFDSGQVRRLDGANGAVTWQRPLPPGSVGYWGISQTPDGGDIVLGSWTADFLTGETGLALEFRSLATGATRGTTLQVTGMGGCGGDPGCGSLTPPTAALAGDLDGDGIGDLFTLSPQYVYGAASGGMLEAYTSRGATRLWRSAFLVPKTDDSFLIAGMDATGDGRRDPVLVSMWLGAFGVDRATTIVSIVDGLGGDMAGIDPAAQVTLQGYPVSFSLPGDVNADGGQDVVLSGAVHYPADNQASVMFEAIGKNGLIWRGGPRYPVSISEMGAGWYDDAGDLNGDGVRDGLVLLGSLSKGVDFVAGVNMRNGGSLWSRTPTNGRFTLPAYADLDGDGGDDVIHDFWAWHPDTDETAFEFTAASGKDLAPLWYDLRTADSGANGWTIYAIGGPFDQTGNEDVLLEYVMSGPGRHLAEAFHGASGERLWSSP